MPRIIVDYTMTGWVEVDLPDDWDESDLEAAQDEAEREVSRQKYNLLSGEFYMGGYQILDDPDHDVLEDGDGETDLC